jgi:hypothetical protein
LEKGKGILKVHKISTQFPMFNERDSKYLSTMVTTPYVLRSPNCIEAKMTKRKNSVLTV